MDYDGDGIPTVDMGVYERVDTVIASPPAPAGLFVAGWVWFSVPIAPAGTASGALLIDFANRLYTWDGAAKTILLYPDDFRTLSVGPSYLTWLNVGESYDPSYLGTELHMPFEYTLSAAGWSWVGVPGTSDIAAMDLSVRKGGVTRTATEDQSDAHPWLNWNWVYWDSAVQTARIMNPFGGGDDTTIYLWYGYRVWANTEDVTIIYPQY